MILDNLTLACLIKELLGLFENAYINKVAELKNGYLKLKLHTKNGSKDLILYPTGFFMSSYSLQARHGKSNLAIALKSELYNKKIVSIKQNELDRVVEIKFLEHSIILEFIGDGNKIFIDKEGKILSCQKNEKWQDRTIKKGEQYIFPKPKGKNPLTVTLEELKEEFSSSKKDAIRTVISFLNISPVAVEEVFFNLKIEKTQKAQELKETQLKKILLQIKEIYSLKKELSPVVYKGNPQGYNFNVFSEKKQIESINSFIDSEIASSLAKAETEKEDTANQKAVSKLEYNLKEQETARIKFEKRISDNQKKAELIYENYSDLEELKKAVQTAVKKGIKEKEIMYKFSLTASKGNKTAGLIKSIDLAKKKFIVEL